VHAGSWSCESVTCAADSPGCAIAISTGHGGALTWTKPGLQQGHSSEYATLVALSGLKLNLSVLTYLRRWQERVQRGEPLPAPELPLQRPYRTWRVRDKLSDEDVQALIKEFSSGTPKHVLADRYSVSLGSVKRLLQQHNIRRRSRYDILP
jgi:hypothetical protein